MTKCSTLLFSWSGSLNPRCKYLQFLMVDSYNWQGTEISIWNQIVDISSRKLRNYEKWLPLPLAWPWFWLECVNEKKHFFKKANLMFFSWFKVSLGVYVYLGYLCLTVPETTVTSISEEIYIDNLISYPVPTIKNRTGWYYKMSYFQRALIKVLIKSIG